MAFAILRTKKLKNFGEIGGSLAHTYRHRPTPNADSYLSKLNFHEKTSMTVKEEIKAKLPKKPRSNAVLCIEYLITASPEWPWWSDRKYSYKTEQETEFFEKAVKWLKMKHGEENVITTSIHYDETTPHLIAYVVPIDPKGKLNCRHFLGGKSKLSQMQTEFHEQVKHLGLERGLIGSTLEHQSIQKYYQLLKSTPQSNKLAPLIIQKMKATDQPQTVFLESKAVHGERVMESVYQDMNEQLQQLEKQANQQFYQLQQAYAAKLTEKEILLEKYYNGYIAEHKKYELLEKEMSPFLQYKSTFKEEYQQLLEDITQKNEDEMDRIREIKTQHNSRTRRDIELATERENKQKLEYKKAVQEQFNHFEFSIQNALNNTLKNDTISSSQKQAACYVYTKKQEYLRADPWETLKDHSNHFNSHFKHLYDLYHSKIDAQCFYEDVSKLLDYYHYQDEAFNKDIEPHKIETSLKCCVLTWVICNQFLDQEGMKLDKTIQDAVKRLQSKLRACDSHLSNELYGQLVKEDERIQKIKEYSQNSENTPAKQRAELRNDHGFEM